ncbi:MAG: family 43 glycosylhydrolase, partial [Bacteroidales bacterium]|nr:family 43 glycosylhydrolase [Bacteroidales bacterium]
AWWSKGHGTLVDDADGNWYVVYHAYRNGFHTLGRSTIIESVEWTDDDWPVLAEADGAKWEQDGLQGDYSYLRDFSNPLLWARWQPGFAGGTLMTATAVDSSYELSASFSVPEGSAAGLYLFYNEEAHFGLSCSDASFSLRIRNESNSATLWKKVADRDWELVEQGVDVSGMHHNNYNGFFALRPAYLLCGDARLESFEYKPI